MILRRGIMSWNDQNGLIYFLFLFIFSFIFHSYSSKTHHRHGHKAYSYSIHKDYRLVYILHTTMTTAETLYRIRRSIWSARSTLQSTSMTELFTCLLTIHRKSLGPMNPSTRCHLSIAQIRLQHLLHLSQLLRLHAHHSGERPVADSQVMHVAERSVRTQYGRR